MYNFDRFSKKLVVNIRRDASFWETSVMKRLPSLTEASKDQNDYFHIIKRRYSIYWKWFGIFRLRKYF